MRCWNLPRDPEHLFEVRSRCPGIGIAETRQKQPPSSLPPHILEMLLIVIRSSGVIGVAYCYFEISVLLGKMIKAALKFR